MKKKSRLKKQLIQSLVCMSNFMMHSHRVLCICSFSTIFLSKNDENMSRAKKSPSRFKGICLKLWLQKELLSIKINIAQIFIKRKR